MLGQQIARLTGRRPRAETTQAQFEQVWLLHRPRIWRLVARLAGSPDDADDLTQQVSVQAFGAFGGFRGEAQALTWLIRIAVNVVLRHRERKTHDTVALSSEHLADYPADAAHGPEARALQSDLRPVVWAALERLPEDLRTTLILQLYEDRKYREIADILDIPLGTVKSRLHHALRRLREELKDYEL
ncbi:MAG: sigma-70 family RNA polymerase sigma factor [Armatimonadota bacterium]|nr:sigma-70 family RNA polymerase sigma factor [Armatimonadota bacterium]